MGLGQALSAYWQQKKRMAGDACEPPVVTQLMAALAPYTWGAWLALFNACGGNRTAQPARLVCMAQAKRWPAPAEVASSSRSRKSPTCTTP